MKNTPRLLGALLTTLILGAGWLRAADDIVLADFEAGNYGGWQIKGTAFGKKPCESKLATQPGFSGFTGKGLAHSHAGRDTKPTGSLTSPEFTIERDFINLLIGGGANPQTVGVKVLVEGKEVGWVGGEKSNCLAAASIPVKPYRGKKAVVVIYDRDPGWWGYIAVDDIRQSDRKVGYEKVEKKLKITGKLLLFPVAKPGTNRNILVTSDHWVKIHALTASLAMRPEDILWWGHLEMDARWYYCTDKLGLLVWQDMPSGVAGKDAKGDRDGVPKSKELADQHELELRTMVGQHINSPSIVWWIVFNESWGQYDTPRLTQMVKDLDPDRLVTGASGWFRAPCGDVIDAHRYQSPAGTKPEGDRIGVCREFGGLGYVVPGHLWVPEQTESSVYITCWIRRTTKNSISRSGKRRSRTKQRAAPPPQSTTR